MLVAFFARLFLEPPVTPDGAEGQKLAEDELGKAKYADPSNLLERFFNWLSEKFGRSALVGVDGSMNWGFIPVIFGLVLVVLVLFAVIHVARRRQTQMDHEGPHPVALFDDNRTASELFKASDAARARGDLDAALIDAYRGAIRHLDERGYINVLPGMTALEAARAAISAVGESALLTTSAQWFNRVYYSSDHAIARAMDDVDRLVAFVRSVPNRPPSKQTAVIT